MLTVAIFVAIAIGLAVWAYRWVDRESKKALGRHNNKEWYEKNCLDVPVMKRKW